MATDLFMPFALPMFQPDPGADIPEVLALFAAARALLDINPEHNFSARNCSTKIKLDEALIANNQLNKVYAVGTGNYQLKNDFVEYSMSLSDQQAWLQRFGMDVPVPVYFRYGPIAPDDVTFETGGIRFFLKGDVLGTLLVPFFYITVLDRNEYYINPLSLFHFIRQNEQIQFYNIPNQPDIPLLPPDYQSPYVSEVARALPAEEKDWPYLSIAGGSKSIKLYNPDSFCKTDYISFLANDTLTIAYENSDGLAGQSIQIEDISSVMYKHQGQSNPLLRGESPTHFVPQADLKPHAEIYEQAQGKKEPGQPLRYAIGVVGGIVLPLPIIIEQDLIDIVRQEYLFHSGPLFQNSQWPVLHIPRRLDFESVGNQLNNPKTKALRAASNYKHTLLNPTESLRVVQLIESTYERIMEDWLDDTEAEDHAAMYIWELAISSSWRNPERNEIVDGVLNSNHQFGKALDLKPANLTGLGHSPEMRFPDIINNPPPDQNVRSFVLAAVFEAARQFFENLLALNPVEKCRKVEIILENFGNELLMYKLKNGQISLETKITSQSVSMDFTLMTDNEKIAWAARHASHVHVGWMASKLASDGQNYVHDYLYRLQLPTDQIP